MTGIMQINKDFASELKISDTLVGKFISHVIIAQVKTKEMDCKNL